MNLARMTMLSICNEMDVKGTMSGKDYVWQDNGVPQDLLGWTLQRLGYRRYSSHHSLNSSGHFVDSYNELQSLLAIRSWDNIIKEIDTCHSTNESIKKKIEDVFTANPLNNP